MCICLALSECAFCSMFNMILVIEKNLIRLCVFIIFEIVAKSYTYRYTHSHTQTHTYRQSNKVYKQLILGL